MKYNNTTTAAAAICGPTGPRLPQRDANISELIRIGIHATLAI